MDHLPLPPGQMGLPFLGETLGFIRDPQFIADRYQQHGPIFKSRILGRPTVFFVGPEAAEFLLSTHMDHFSWREGWPITFKTLLGESLFLQEGEEHRRNRRLIMPALHGPALASYVCTIEDITKRYLKKWEQQQEFAWFDEFKQLTFEIASPLLLGASPGAEVAHLSQLFTTLTNGLFGFGAFPGSPYSRAIAARKQILQHLEQVIYQRQQQPTHDALSLLIQARDEAGNSLSLKEIKDQALLLLFAGHETTTSMLTWFCLELGRHPNILEQARTEQQSLGTTEPLTLALLGQMPYLDQIFLEVERLHPPVGGGFRGVIKPFEFKGYQVPAGWMAQYSILMTHRLPELYPNPEQFDPDRFSPARSQPKLPTFSLIGFGGGPRICVGLAFAKLEMKLVAAHLLRHYDWQLLPNQSLEPVRIPTRRPQDRLRVQFRPLSQSAAIVL